MIRPAAIDNPRAISRSVKVTVGIISLILAAFSKDPLLFLYGMAVIIFLVSIMYHEGEPPVLLFSAVMAWLFFQAQLINGLIRGEEIASLDYYSPTRKTIIWLGHTAVLVFFLGIHVISHKVPKFKYSEMQAFLFRIKLQRLTLAYVVTSALLLAIGSRLWLFPGLSQPFFMLTQFKWTLFFLLFVTTFAQDRLKFWLFFIILVEIALSFFSFFSHFKEPIYFSFISYWIFYFRTSGIGKVIPLFLIAITFYIGVYWTTVKEDYREFLNRGTGTQAVAVSRVDAYAKLTELVSKVKPEDLEIGFDELVTRLSWIGAFDAVYNHVPKVVGHANGKLWLQGITRPFVPRLLFPEKKSLTDSKELNYYSGLQIDDKTTSISLSMIAGSYVDFGSWGMFAPLFLLGIFCGWLYRKVVKFGRQPIIGFALTMPMIYLLQIHEQSINRICSSLVLYFLVVWFFSKFLLGPLLRYVIKPAPSQAQHKPAVNAPSLG